jgi:hypothetical protein
MTVHMFESYDVASIQSRRYAAADEITGSWRVVPSTKIEVDAAELIGEVEGPDGSE